MKPGPATSALATSGSRRAVRRRSPRRARAASFRASLASTMAALVARSPWLGIARRLDHDARKIGAEPGSTSRACRRAHGVSRACCEDRTEGSWRHFAAAGIAALRLTQFRRRVKMPRVLGQRVAVGHAGDENRRSWRARALASPRASACRPFRRQVGGCRAGNGRTDRAPRLRPRPSPRITRAWRYMRGQRKSLIARVGLPACAGENADQRRAAWRTSSAKPGCSAAKRAGRSRR